MNEREMMHGEDWDGEDLAGWWIGEKLDGCRVLWDGSRLWTRGGNVVRIPEGWAAALPDVILDGELWAGRGGFKAAALACQHGRFAPEVELRVFDAAVPGDYPRRLEAARRAIAGLAFASVVEHAPVASTAEALARLRAVKAGGGEGIVARRPEYRYHPGRTREILKLKYPELAEAA